MLIQTFGHISMHLNMYGGPGAQMDSYTPSVKSSKLTSRDLQRFPDTANRICIIQRLQVLLRVFGCLGTALVLYEEAKMTIC